MAPRARHPAEKSLLPRQARQTQGALGARLAPPRAAAP
eukprot:CAMPEP_0202056778 /NCGR_PEP_ID=MMETSP0963-20130614/25624_1 /ASSEMBLY_ACC=CAM_ASM_000494 /TAXON_ID=4773 /ORGANISM="Schizochytrium aggregatum, Strain ATCC28209" /LENGTH=37 /DNA_ID= /DNA_START= /DNA_END= /DNA_ORIENTATION=